MIFNQQNKRLAARLHRQSSDAWQLRVEDDKLITRNILNISPGGLSFKAPLWSQFESGQKLRFSLCLNKQECHDLEGRVVWVKKVEDAPGAMQQLGVEFVNLPARADISIMKEINDTYLRSRREAIEMGRPLVKRVSHSDAKAMLKALAGGVIIMSFLIALIVAAHIHQQTHPEESIAFKFNKAFLERSISNTEK
jgi:hypothetical protein